MARLLVINSSPRTSSVSRQLTQHFVEDWKTKDADARIVERDLAAEPLPQIDEAWIAASYTPPAQRTAVQQELLTLSDKLIDEVLAADVIVFGVPMHNFSIPTSLKAWVDLVARAGRTFSYTDRGPKGLVPSGKKVVVMGSRGGPHTPGSATDFQEPYLKHILGFIGLTDVTFIHADQQSMGGPAALHAVEAAIARLSAITAQYSEQFAVAA